MRGIDAFGSSGKELTGAHGAVWTLLDAGLEVIAGLRRTTGSGEPERGEAFSSGARRFRAAEQLVASAAPTEWTGAGAESYAAANRRQAQRVAAVASLDNAAGTVLARQADQIVHHRKAIDEEAYRLALLSRTSSEIATAPGVGPAIKATFEMAAVNSALDTCCDVLDRLTRHVHDNTDELRGIAEGYSAVTDGAALTDGAVLAEVAALTEGEPAPPGASPCRDTANPPAGDLAGEVASTQALPADGMSTLTTAMGAAGGMIGALVTPVAAALTGVAGTAAQALSSLPSSADSAGLDADVGGATGEPITDEPAAIDEDGDASRGEDAAEDDDDRAEDGPRSTGESAPAEALAEPPLAPPVPAPAAPIRPPR